MQFSVHSTFVVLLPERVLRPCKGVQARAAAAGHHAHGQGRPGGAHSLQLTASAAGLEASKDQGLPLSHPESTLSPPAPC